MKENQPANWESQTQADSKIGESAFYDCFGGAVVSAGAAVDANVSIDNVHLVTLGDSLYGAVVSACTALDASISDLVSHDFPSIKYVIDILYRMRFYFNTYFAKCNGFFEKGLYIFASLRGESAKVGGTYAV